MNRIVLAALALLFCAALSAQSTCEIPGLYEAPACGNQLEYNGHFYETVMIGTQCWFTENLRTTTYRDGTPITSNLDNATWAGASSGVTTVYGESDSGTVYSGNTDVSANLDAYGRLYNWYAVDHATLNAGQELCPTDWHVPSDAEWTTLRDGLGGASAAGEKMKEAGTTYWNTAGGTNESGFLGRPGGYRAPAGSMSFEGSRAYFWSSTDPEPDKASAVCLSHTSSSASDDAYTWKHGFSVRCVKD
jgi:uncharacterized protein (TIGR02145 family)